MHQSDNLNYQFFGCVISDLYLFQKIVLLNPCFLISKKLVLSLMDKVTNGTQRLRLFIWNVPPVVCFSATTGTAGLDSGSSSTATIIVISSIINSFNHEKSDSASQLINGKSRILQK